MEQVMDKNRLLVVNLEEFLLSCFINVKVTVNIALELTCSDSAEIRFNI